MGPVGLFGGELKLNLVSMPTRSVPINRIIYWDTKRCGGTGFISNQRCDKSHSFRYVQT